ncbi:MAG: hypothetical protein ACLFUV_01975 [Methanomassiliicoccales archaeon]
MCQKALGGGTEERVVIRADDRDGLGHPMEHQILNQRIRETLSQGARHIVVEGVLGQRYIGSTASDPETVIEIRGTPGNNLGAFLNGSTIKVYGNAQDQTGNTMNCGSIIVHGSVGDVTGLAARGGMILIRDDSGYRAGIHMKEFRGSGPSLVIGGRVGDYLGEYMAGGTIMVLGLGIQDRPVIGQHVGAGMHGGRMFVMGPVSPKQLAPGATMGGIGDQDREDIDRMVHEYEAAFDIQVERRWGEFHKIVPSSSRPFIGYYDPTMI